MKLKFVIGVFGLVECMSYADLTSVTDSYQLTFKNEGLGVTAVTEKQAVLSADLPTPAFWFDCSERTGWEYRLENGTNFVTKIPSKVGNRFLTADKTLEGTSWSGWASSGAAWGDYFPPALVEYDDLPGGPALDFGRFGSRRALVFNPVSFDGGTTTRSALQNIGTVLAIWGSQEGGGYILGGGDSAGDATGYRWCRVFDYQMSHSGLSSTAIAQYWCAIMNWSQRQGLYIHDDMRLPADTGAMNGSWEAIAFSTPTAIHETYGLGMNDSREWMQGRSGGMRIAEMLIFDSILTEDQMRRANVYLTKKWLNRAPRGWNGNAKVGKIRLYPRNDVSVELNVPAGETLSVGTLQGGRLAKPDGVNRKFVKTGAGTLNLGNAVSCGNAIDMQDGTLRLSRKSAPTVDELPMGLYVRFDASDSGCLETEPGEDGRTYVKTLRNLAGGKRYAGDIYARPRLDVKAGNPTTTDLRPWVRDVGLKSGRPIIDFGWRGADGRYLVFGTNEVMTAEHEAQGLAGIHTAVALVRIEAGGGNLMDNYFKRSYIWCNGTTDGNYQTAILTDQGTDYTGEVYLNGRKIGSGNGAGGYLHSGYHVVAYRVRPGEVICIGATDYRAGLTSGSGTTQPRGGVQLGELLLWNRPLSEEEVVAASAYLAGKWLEADIPGYKSNTDAAIPDVQVVKTTGTETKIDVPAGETAMIRQLLTASPTVKTGKGTLKVGPESDTRALVVADGAVMRAPAGSVVTSAAAVAPGAVLHLDASDANSLLTHEADGRKIVDAWYSKVGYEYAAHATQAYRPWINEDESALLNGLPVVDFGGFSTYSSGREAADAHCLYLSGDFDSVRAVYLVLGSQAGGGNPLGERYYDDGNWYDFLRYGNMTATLALGMFQGGGTAVQTGEVYTNGVLTTHTAKPTGGYELFELHPSAGTHLSALGINRGAYMFGGFRLGEIIVYERPLTAREKVATRNYLLAKWFPDVPQQALPDEPALEPVAVAKVVPAEGASLNVTMPLSAATFEGPDSFEKAGAETLAVKDLSDYSGSLKVSDGSLALTGEPLEHEPELITSGRILHLDASDGVVAVTNADGSVSVSQWNSKLGDGWTATPAKCYTTAMSYPTLLEYELNGLPVVKMANDGWNGAHHDLMLFYKDGVQTNLCNIKSAFWVIGSQEGGGFVLGGGLNADGTTHGYWFHRGGGAGSGHADTIINHNANANLKGTKAVWRLNGTTVSAESTGLTGGYDRLSFVQTAEATAPVNADGLACDGRILNTPPEDYRARVGRQRLAELIVYDRIVTADERARIEAYLARKWGFQQKAVANNAVIELAQGATLLTTGSQYVGTLSGAGTVEGDVTIRNFIGSVDGVGLQINGTLTIAANPTVTFRGLSEGFPKGEVEVRVVLAAASDYANMERLTGAVFAGLPGTFDCTVRFKVIDGKLTACVRRTVGMVINVR